MENFPTIYTQRLVLRKLTPDDFLLLVKHANNRKIAHFRITINFRGVSS
jgi:hypothetical protein